MRKTVFLLSLLLFWSMTVGILDASDVNMDFKNARWGMSKTEVILSEQDLPAGEEDNILYYRPDFFTDSFLLELQDARLSVFEDARYYFDGGVLVGGERTFHPVIMNDPKFDYGALFGYLFDLLNTQYDKGELQEIWLTEPRAGEINQLVYAGELTKIAMWFTETTQITLTQRRADHYGTIIVKTTLNYKQLEKLLTEDEAVDIVFALPDVKAFGERMKEAGQRWGVMYHGIDYFGDDLSAEDGWYHFQVYESHPTHIATFNWYHVSAKTGEVVDMHGVSVR